MTTDQKRLLEFLLPQYIDGKATPEEEQHLFLILNSKELEGEKLAELVEELMAAEPALETYKEEEWQQVLQNIKANSNEKSPAKLLRLPVILRWIVAASVAVAILIGGIWIKNNGKNKEVPISKVITVQDVPSPASTVAVLTLSNGKKVFLDSAKQGLFTIDQGIKLIKSADGQLVYEGVDLKGETQLSYNTLSNPRGSQVVGITLADGTKVWLNSESTIRYPTVFSGNERRVEVTGEAYFEVVHNAAKPFLVNTQNMSVEVLGTHFNINAYDDEPVMATTLLEGSVRITKEKQEVILKEGQQARVSNSKSGSIENKISIINDADLKSVIAWKNGLFDFNNAHITDITRQLARWYNVEVEYKGTVPDRHYTGAIRKSVNISEVIKMLETAGGVDIAIVNKKLVIQKQ